MLQVSFPTLEDQIHPWIELFVPYCPKGRDIGDPLGGVIAEEEVSPARELLFPYYLPRTGVLKSHMNCRGVIAAGQPEYDLRRGEEHHWALYPDHELHIFGGLTSIFYKAQGQLEHGRVD